MTKEEFTIQYAVRTIAAFGLHAEPCDCGEEGCEGWQMVSDERFPIGSSFLPHEAKGE